MKNLDSLFHKLEPELLKCMINSQNFFSKLNPTWTKLTGHTLEELTLKEFSHFVHPDDISKTMNIIQKLKFSDDQISHLTNRLQHIDGSYLLLSWNMSFDLESQALYAVAVRLEEDAEDILEVKKLTKTIEEQQVQILNAARMSALGEMASGIGHEINNPLAIIE